MKRQTGFTLIELMVSLAIGLFLIAGVFYVYINSSNSQKVVEMDVTLVDNARFALETISFDLKHVGNFGALNHEDRGKIDPASIANFIDVPGQCGGTNSGWVVNIDNAVFSSNDANMYASDCIPSAKYSNGDVLEVRYVNRINQSNGLFNNVLYVNGDAASGEYFLGSGTPATIRPLGKNYQSVAKVYYISSYSDVVGDGIPALRMVSLQPGPVVSETVLLSGVSDLQLQFGLVADNVSSNSTSVVTWQHPTPGMDWKRVIAARIWIVMQTTKRVTDVDTSTSFEIAGVVNNYPNDGFRRAMVTTSVRLRNMNTGY